MLNPWIIRTLTLPPLLASLVPRNFRRYHTPTITLLKIATIPTYYGISIAILRYEDGDIRVMLVTNCGLVEILVLKFVIPVACTYGEPLCDEVGA